MTDKKQYLKKYLLNQKRIERLNELIIINPRSKGRYLDEIADCEKRCEEIEAKINELDDELLREILFLKYIGGENLKEISKKISYSQRHTERMHTQAIEKIVI